MVKVKVHTLNQQKMYFFERFINVQMFAEEIINLEAKTINFNNWLVMTDFTIMDNEIHDSSPLSSAFVNLSKRILLLKKLQFDASDMDFDYNILVEQKKISFVGGKWIAAKDDLLYYVFLKEALFQKHQIIGKDVDGLFTTLKIIDQHFNDRRFFSGITEFLEQVYAIALQYQYFLFSPDYLQFFSTYEKSSVNYQFWRFLGAFYRLIAFLNLPPQTMHILFRVLYSFFDLEKEGINSNLALLNQTVAHYGEQNNECAISITDICLGDLDFINRTILVFLWAGILTSDKRYVSRLKTLFATPAYQTPILGALSKASFSPDEMKGVLEIIDSMENTEDNEMSAAELYAGYLINADDNNSLATEVNRRFIALIKNPNPVIAAVCVNLLNRFKTPAKIHPYLTDLITTDYFDKRLIANIDFLLMRYDDAAMYFEFVLAFCQKNSISDLPVDHVAPFLRNKNIPAFDKILITHLIHDNGQVRFIAGRILRTLGNYSEHRRFEQDLTTLEETDQLKLFASVLNTFSEPKYILPFILPISISNSPKVRDFTLQKLKAYAEDYGKAVQDILEQEWQPMTAEQSAIYTNIKTHTQTFWEALEKKGTIKELNPLYIQSGLLETFTKSHGKQFSRNMTEHVEKRSAFHQIAQHVAINKGGGWQSAQSDSVSKLFTVSASMSLPRSYFISPDNFEWKRRIDQMKNWKNFTADEQ